MRRPALTWEPLAPQRSRQYQKNPVCLPKKFPLHLQPSLNQETFWLQRAKGILLSLFPQADPPQAEAHQHPNRHCVPIHPDQSHIPGSTARVESARSKDAAIAGKYKTTSNLYLRVGAGTGKTAITLMPAGSSVQCYGYYTTHNGTRWYYVAYGDKTGFCSSAYLRKA